MVMTQFRGASYRSLREISTAVFTAALLAAVYYAAYWLRFEGRPDALYERTMLQTLPLVVLLKTAAFVGFRLHRGWRRFVTFHDLVVIAEATTLGTFLLVMADRFFFPEHSVPRGIVLLDWGATLILFCILRGASRSIHERYRGLLSPNAVKRRALIVGADSVGEGLLRAMRIDKRHPFQVVGFIDHDGRGVGDVIGGVPVVGSLEQLPACVRRHAVDELFILSGDLPGVRVRDVVEQCRSLGVHVSMLPSYGQMLSGQLEFKPRDISIDDLLRRQPVSLETNEIRSWLAGRVLMVTGSAGSIGSEICRQLLQFGPARLVLVDRWENGQYALERQLRALAPGVAVDIRIADVNDVPRMRRLFADYLPEVVFHAAAYKHVPLMEQNPGEAVKNIVATTRVLADLADELGVRAFVQISTDKAVNPTSVMGTCKRVAELYVQSLAERSACRFVTVRFGNVLNSAGSVVPLFCEQIAAGGPVTITDLRMERFFMTIPEAAQLVIQAGAMGQGGEIFVLDMGEPVRIVDLAHDMIRLSGLRIGHDIEVKEVGLRPGEKLFEELNVEGEVHQPTKHPKIRIAQRASQLSADEIAQGVDELQSLADESHEQIIAQLSRLVGEYKPDLIAARGLKLFAPPENRTSNSRPRAA